MNIEKIGPDRLNALSDGVIAIALTLLVLGIDIPSDHDFDKDGLVSFLFKLEPSLVAYLTSFIIVAFYWILHHRIFGELKYVNQTIIILNLIFLFSISLVPFISKLKSLYRFDSVVVGIFALAHIITGVILLSIWNYMKSHTELLKAPLDKYKDRYVRIKILVIPIVCAIAIPAAVINIHVGTYIFMIIPIVYAVLPKWGK